MSTIGEIVSKQYYAWCDKMSRTKFSGKAVCPADGETYWFVLGMVCDSYEEYEYYLNKYFGCDL